MTKNPEIGPHTDKTSQASGAAHPQDSLPYLMQAFLWEKELNDVVPETLAYYKQQFAHFARVVNVEKWLKLDVKEQRNELRRWMKVRKEQPTRSGNPTAMATVDAHYRAVRAWVRWLVREDFLQRDPTATIEPPGKGWAPKDTYSQGEIRALLELCPPNRWWGARDRVVVCLATFCGIRRKEISNLDIDDIIMERSIIVLKKTKNRKQRTIYIPAPVRKAILYYHSKWRDRTTQAFVQTRDGRRLSPTMVGQIWYELCERAGVSGRKGPHRGRHTYITESLRSGADINDVRLAAGHSSVAVTQLYAGTIESEEAAMRLRKLKVMEDWG